MADEDIPHVLLDASSLIGLLNSRASGRRMTALANRDVVRFPESVAREVRKGADRAAVWVKAHPEFAIREQQHHLRELERVMRLYGGMLTTSRTAADGVVVALGKFYEGSRIVVSDDQGVQAVCALERIYCLPLGGFRRLAQL